MAKTACLKIFFVIIYSWRISYYIDADVKKPRKYKIIFREIIKQKNCPKNSCYYLVVVVNCPHRAHYSTSKSFGIVNKKFKKKEIFVPRFLKVWNFLLHFLNKTTKSG